MKLDKKYRDIALCWSALILAVMFFVTFLFYRLRPVIMSNCVAKAENVITNAVNKAIVNITERENISYDTISVVSKNGDGNITGIEIDTNKINQIKSLISAEIYDIISKNPVYDVPIPLGDFLLNDYTNGMGPMITFKMQFSHKESIDFDSRFTDAGINNVLHQIKVKVNVTGGVLAVGSRKKISVNTSLILAQTVIAGTVPESFTNVLEDDGSDVADKIFNYADVK